MGTIAIPPSPEKKTEKKETGMEGRDTDSQGCIKLSRFWFFSQKENWIEGLLTRVVGNLVNIDTLELFAQIFNKRRISHKLGRVI